MSYVLSEKLVPLAVKNLMDYCKSFWDELGDWAGASLPAPPGLDVISQLLIQIALPDQRAEYFLDWLVSLEPDFVETAQYGPYRAPIAGIGRLWPPPAVFFYHGIYLPSGTPVWPLDQRPGKGNQSDYSIQPGSLLAGCRYQQNKNRRCVKKLKHHRCGYVLERGTLRGKAK